MPRKSRGIPEVNAGSMADIAFLLLVFFLVTSHMNQDKGLKVVLPPYIDAKEKKEEIRINERNILKVLVNGNDELLVEGGRMRIDELTEITKMHLLNEGRDPNFSDSSQIAIVSLQHAKSTTYQRYVEVYNELIRGYDEVRDEYSKRKFGRPFNQLVKKGDEFNEVVKKYPLKISEAEPFQSQL
ncbi:MAG: biopolymer transporter ExbD [Flavobacteriales bacterium]|nr:biopolymer transporter ExbD [Flavobacteriales bacterium]